MGEAHPASRKVVVTFSPHGIPNITTEQVLKLKKLAGPRYNPSKNEIKMSCESFETQAQNKRYLATTINALIAEATDPEADSFADVPLDLRHHKRKPKHRFPEEWKMTNERRMQLEGGRRERMLGEVKRIEENEVASGLQDIEKMKGLDLKQEEHIMAEARAPMPTGKMGKREMGQQKVQRP